MTTTSYNIYQQITSVRLASTINITGDYFNGALNNGVGATLTALTEGALSLDGVLVEVGDRLLLKDQTSANQNGLYVVQSPGSSMGLWMLERAPDFQSLEQLKVGQYFSVGAGNTFEGSMYVLVEPLPSTIGMGTFNFVNVADGAIPSGPYLLKANNLSDVSNSTTAFENLGLGRPGILAISDADFAAGGGTYTLTNPPPIYVIMTATTPGRVLQLPPQNAPNSLQESQNITLITSHPSQLININNGSGTLIFQVGQDSTWQAIPNDRTTVAGAWEFLGIIQTLNALSGNAELTSTDGSITIIPNPANQHIDLSASASVIGGTENIVWIGTNGSDITGTGTFDKPYATLSHAITSITTASSTNPFSINFGTGKFTDVNVALKPWIYINGNNSTLSITGSLTLHSSWSGGGQTSIGGFKDLNLPATVTLDFDSLSPPSSLINLFNNITASSSTINILGDSVNGTVALISNNFGFSTEFDYNLSNCYGAIQGGASGNISLENCPNFTVIAMTEIGDLNIINSGTSNITLLHEASYVTGNTSYLCTSSGNISALEKGITHIGSLTLDNGVGGGVITFKANTLDSLPILLNGATYTPTSISDAMEANKYFTPTSYTPAGGGAGLWSAASVTGNLAGINTALSRVSTNLTQLIYVNALTGNDSNNGSIGNPLQTYDAARLLAISRGAASNKSFTLMCVGDFSITGNMTLSPFVNIRGTYMFDTKFTISGNIVLDASWNTTSIGFCYINNCYFKATAMNLTFTTYQGSGTIPPIVVFDTCCVTEVNTVNLIGSGTSTSGIFEQIFFMNCAYSPFVNTGLPVYNSTNIGLTLYNSDNSGGVNSIANTANAGAFTTLIGTSFQSGNIDCSCSTAGALVVQFQGVQFLTATVTLNGPNVMLFTDADSWSFSLVLTGGAAFPGSVRNFNLVDGLAATSYTPVNFTPVGGTIYPVTSQTAYNRGIDNALPKAHGTATLVGGTVTVASSVTASNDSIQLTCITAGGTQGFITVTYNPGVSFTLTSSSALDTSTFKWKNLGA